MKCALFALLVLGCGSRHDPPATPQPQGAPRIDAGAPAIDAGAAPAIDASVATTKPLPTHGAVCQLGASSLDKHRTVKVVECGPGLECCYPCGIAGCDSVCHTNAECQADRQRP